MKKHFKKIATLFCFILLIQSCSVFKSGFTVYKSANVSLSEASETNKKVKITNSDGEKLKFYRVEKTEDGKFIGKKMVKMLKGKKIFNEFSIDKKDIEKVQIQNKTLSTVFNVTGILVVGAAGFVAGGVLFALLIFSGI
ncbi:hypothetical protein [Aestuariivivens sediminicola]|uniref:hypothetical protein n=1 Tax=Aestuariivivens sediminicola TaxID=2913560 RepID=UPI001F597281|nr:hypothetical protein [Aestuariivivens sediminicola]